MSDELTALKAELATAMADIDRRIDREREVEAEHQQKLDELGATHAANIEDVMKQYRAEIAKANAAIGLYQSRWVAQNALIALLESQAPVEYRKAIEAHEAAKLIVQHAELTAKLGL